MRRTLPLLLVLLSLAAPLAAGSGNVWIHAAYRQTFFAGEIWDYIPPTFRETKDKGGLGMQLAVALEFTPGTSLGISAEYLQIQTANAIIGSFVIPMTAQALPILVTYRQYSGPLFIQVDAGICFWNGDKGGRDKTIAVGGGYTWPLTKWLNLDCSLRGLFIFSDSLLIPVILSAGVSARL
jgi:hypothetical protein